MKNWLIKIKNLFRRIFNMNKNEKIIIESKFPPIKSDPEAIEIKEFEDNHEETPTLSQSSIESTKYSRKDLDKIKEN